MLDTFVYFANSHKQSADFVADSEWYFYYTPNYRLDTHSTQMLNFLVEIFQKVKTQDPTDFNNCLRAETTKFPYIFKSFSLGNPYMFPLIIGPHANILTGFGRAITSNRYFPQMKIPAIVIDKNIRTDLLQLHSLKELIDVIVTNDYWKNKDLNEIQFGFYIDSDGTIAATDYQVGNIDRFKFDFINDAGENIALWNQISQLLEQHAKVTSSNAYEILDLIVKLKT